MAMCHPRPNERSQSQDAIVSLVNYAQACEETFDSEVYPVHLMATSLETKSTLLSSQRFTRNLLCRSPSKLNGFTLADLAHNNHAI